MHGCGVLRMVPNETGIHQLDKDSNVVEAYAAYLQRLVLVAWLTGWLAASVGKEAHLTHRSRLAVLGLL